jgi:hypothetical protein
MTIDWTKPIQTSFGGKARVLATDLKGKEPVVVAWELDSGKECLCLVNLDGKADARLSSLSFKNRPTKITRWVNVYPASSTCVAMHMLYMTKKDADHGATPDRLHCIEISWEE